MENTEKKTVLVIDDMSTILEHAKQILKDSYKLIPSTGGRQALDIISKRKPDIIMLDINMPDMGGFEVLSALKADESTAAIPVVLMSTEISGDTESRGYELGAADFIIKPFSQSAVLKVLESRG